MGLFKVSQLASAILLSLGFPSGPDHGRIGTGQTQESFQLPQMAVTFCLSMCCWECTIGIAPKNLEPVLNRSLVACLTSRKSR
jgi:hypothetical protein